MTRYDLVRAVTEKLMRIKKKIGAFSVLLQQKRVYLKNYQSSCAGLNKYYEIKIVVKIIIIF